ncbi:MAG: rsmG [Sphingomonadales bacterium]|nr:rsmG [Sphingomonadales bacterium]
MSSAAAELALENVPRETLDKLNTLVALVRSETERQNLISSSTIDDIWDRHIVDSIQLLKFAKSGTWMDLGTGAGFPGLVIAILNPDPIVLVEERRLRHEFLSRAVVELGLQNVTVVGSRVEQVPAFSAEVITARAFAPLEKIFSLAHRFSTSKTRWVLPKGRKANEELESVRTTWHGDFRLEPSVTDPTSSIIIAENVTPRGKR